MVSKKKALLLKGAGSLLNIRGSKISRRGLIRMWTAAGAASGVGLATHPNLVYHAGYKAGVIAGRVKQAWDLYRKSYNLAAFYKLGRDNIADWDPGEVEFNDHLEFVEPTTKTAFHSTPEIEESALQIVREDYVVPKRELEVDESVSVDSSRNAD